MAKVDEYIKGKPEGPIFRDSDGDDCAEINATDGDLEIAMSTLKKDDVPAFIKWLIEWYTE